ncbi:MAG: prepilin-type N-terminal cleavage/methylation domain-containing protein [Nitrospiraceae bacterium]|nr:MAG: prepilin-type N-terminal cleavage/methylation domain-containing protein [Nitrospiraceae bacterium]
MKSKVKKTKSKKWNNEGGFTLVEIAIVMVIIGLLLGAVLKGQEMINNAKIKNLASQYNSIVAAVYSYQDKYGAFPGDDNRATSRFWATGTCATAVGNGDGYIYEYYRAAQHLACAGLIKGSYNGTSDFMRHTYGGNVIVYYETIAGRTGNDVRFYNLLPENAQALDLQLDDGVYNTGTCRATAAYTGTTPLNFGCFF